MPAMRSTTWRVGALARRTGLTVRTLHYYDEIGLLSPSLRTDAGYRLYTPDDIARLQQITSLRHMGFTLGEIRECLADADLSVRRVVELHIARLTEQVALQRDLLRRLEAMATQLSAAEEVSVEEFIDAMEVMDKMNKYYTPEQREQLEERKQTVGEERIRQVEAEWPELMAQVRAEMERGTDPAGERVQGLARRWMRLVEEFTGGDPGVATSLGAMWQQKETIHGIETAPMRELMTYIGKAMAAGKQRG
jgi:DNA-binding transcriptional MerR regulator